MSKFVTLHGFSGNGVDLNFEVIAYESEEVLLASTPAENTIGVVTTTPMTSWSFSATEPINPENGMIWITIGVGGDKNFNALKKNELQVYPINNVKQYVGAVWVVVTAMNFKNGAWNLWWNGKLYNNGDEFVSVTGGWKAASGAGQKATFNSTNITVSKTGTNRNFETALYTKNKINTTGFTKLTAVLTNIANPVSTNYWGVYVGLTSQNTDSCPTDSMVASAKHSKTGSKTLTVDISKKQGLYYPVVLGDVATFVVTKIYLS